MEGGKWQIGEKRNPVLKTGEGGGGWRGYTDGQ